MFPDGDKVQHAWNRGLYDHMANIEAENRDQVVHIGNGEHDSEIEHLENKFGRKMHNITIGDVVEDPDGTRWFVNFSGFEKV